MKPLASYLCAASSLLLLAACAEGSAKQALGLDRNPPDEFRVVARPPLSVPPEFNLEPPSATSEAPGQLPVSEQAKTLLTGDKAATPEKPAAKTKAGKTKSKTAADSAFLEKAGATAANPDIRKELVEEKYLMQRKEEEEGDSWWNVLPGLSKKSEPTVDSSKEAQRIKQNESSGKPVTEGETPVQKGKTKNTLDYILGN